MHELARMAAASALAGALLLAGTEGRSEDQQTASVPAPAEADAQTSELAKKAQNPIANLISVPFQNNTTFEYGPRHRPQNILNIQPVIPFPLSEELNLITRWILPVVHQPSFAKGDRSETGLGDLNPTLFLAASVERDLMVGIGPTFLFPTATDRELGAKKRGAGAFGSSSLASGEVGRWRACQQHLVLCWLGQRGRG